MKYLQLYLIVFAGLLLATGCRKDDVNTPVEPDNQKKISELVVQDSFDWSTSRDVVFRLGARNNESIPLPGVRIDVYLQLEQLEDGSLAGDILFSGVTGEDGNLEITAPLPAYMREVWVTTRYIGLPGETKVAIAGDRVDFILGGVQALNVEKSVVQGNTWPNFSYLGTFNVNGTPNYLAGIEPISTEFLADVNATFPEYQPVPAYHPQYLAAGNETNTVLTEPAEVWVVFVHEGAGWKNVLGFYTYPAGNPPANPQQIGNITIIFPNVSFPYLTSGMKVKLGEFPAGTEVGWVLIANGWVNGNVTTGTHMIYSNSEWNPATDPSMLQQFVQLYDPGRDIVLLGIEDMRRQLGGDNDFNDAMFYVESNPIVAVATTNMPVITYTATDTDDDGISDNFDEYPTDPSRAFNQYYPSQSGYATMAFEDLWPGKGDYDFNDLVVKYRYKQILNANNQVAAIEAVYSLIATGASFRNGFGVELPVSQTQVSSITGCQLNAGYITTRPNGTESGNDKASFIVFDDSYSLLTYPGTGLGVNTTPGSPWVAPTEFTVTIQFVTPQPASALGTPPFNPFMIVNKNRSKEVHLPNNPPTQLAGPEFFGTVSDDSNPAEGRYYKTSGNLPWAINIIDSFDYPVEKEEITNGYLKFGNWAESNGQVYYDWYQNLPGYRVANSIY